MSDRLPALRRRVGDEPTDELLNDLLLDAETFAKCYTGLEELPAQLEPLIVSYAAATYRRMGAEGETAHREGDIELRFDTDRNEALCQLRRYRVARAGLAREG